MANSERGAETARQNQHSQTQTASFTMNNTSVILLNKMFMG